MASNYQTPGVYINEVNAFPNAVVPVATAVPAFIGYTPCADSMGQSCYNKPVKITSFADFQAIFTLANPPAPAPPAKPYSPSYYLVAQKGQPGPSLSIAGQSYAILPDPNTIYYLYNAIRLFYLNGGGDAYIVAVAPYGPPSGKPAAQRAINPNVKLTDLQNALALLETESEPTMYVCPDATLLSDADNAIFMQAMLQLAGKTQTALCLFDVIGGLDPDPVNYTQAIQAFRNAVGNSGLNYGAAYFPYVGTTIMQSGEIDFTNLFGGDVTQLLPLVNPPSAPNPAAAQIIAKIQQPPHGTTNSQLNAALSNASPTYKQILDHVTAYANILPPSAAMAGVYTVNDATSGVWNSPANTGIVGAVSLPINLSDTQQDNLNSDPATGKSINAIRFFSGRGILVWGARTLDGNSQDWQYISARRMVTFIEQSIKVAAVDYVFEPNNANTWAAVKSMIESFLMTVWKEGGLIGATPADAFSVAVGLGSTMRLDDLLNGFMRITVRVAVTHPAEYIVITFQQEQATSS